MKKFGTGEVTEVDRPTESQRKTAAKEFTEDDAAELAEENES